MTASEHRARAKELTEWVWALSWLGCIVLGFAIGTLILDEWLAAAMAVLYVPVGIARRWCERAVEDHILASMRGELESWS